MMNRPEFETVMAQNPAAAALAAMGVVSAATSSVFHLSVRDDNHTRVFRDDSGVVFIERATRDESWFRAKPADLPDTEIVATSRERLHVPRPADDERRFEAVLPLLEGARLCDINPGTGGFAQRAVAVARSVAVVDPRDAARTALQDRLGDTVAFAAGHGVLPGPFDIITLFEGLERSRNPVGLLLHLLSSLAPGGHLVLETPNARNTLLRDIDLPALREVAFSSEDLVLHTRQSLAAMLASTGFVDVAIIGVQRRGLAAHAGWLVHGTPGGVIRYGDKSTLDDERAYEASLNAEDGTDTLFAFARAP